MGFDDLLAPAGVAPLPAENRLAPAHAADLGTADLAQIEIVGLAIADAITEYA